MPKHPISFEVLAQDGQARCGRLTTPHGVIETPAFVPVATLGAVKAVSAEDLERLGAQALIANAYHLYLMPGERVIEGAGGLHAFMGWRRPLIPIPAVFRSSAWGPERSMR